MSRGRASAHACVSVGTPVCLCCPCVRVLVHVLHVHLLCFCSHLGVAYLNRSGSLSKPLRYSEVKEALDTLSEEYIQTSSHGNEHTLPRLGCAVAWHSTPQSVGPGSQNHCKTQVFRPRQPLPGSGGAQQAPDQPKWPKTVGKHRFSGQGHANQSPRTSEAPQTISI